VNAPRKKGVLHCEDVSLEKLAFEYGTPLFVYSLASLRQACRAYVNSFKAFSPVVAYSVKANPSLAILQSLAAEGAGADIVSGGELFKAMKAGIPADRIVYAGVGKSAAEMAAALEAGVLLFNVESLAELELLNQTAAQLGKRAPVAVRVNPDVDPRTHSYITTGKKESKFGLDIKAAVEAYQRMRQMPHIEPAGVHCHIGSQITTLPPFLQAAEKVARLVGELKGLGIPLKWFDLGGGLGITYNDETPPAIGEMAAAVAPFIAETGCRLIVEPGRSIVGPAGTLLASVLYIKETPIHRYVITDTAMNDLVRPSLYDAYHPIELVRLESGREEQICEIVGPICETGDFLAKGRPLASPKSGDILAIGGAGAYGYAMSSNYNQRPRAAEVLVDGARHRLIRRRETYDDLMRTEREAQDDWKE